MAKMSPESLELARQKQARRRDRLRVVGKCVVCGHEPTDPRHIAHAQRSKRPTSVIWSAVLADIDERILKLQAVKGQIEQMLAK